MYSYSLTNDQAVVVAVNDNLEILLKTIASQIVEFEEKYEKIIGAEILVHINSIIPDRYIYDGEKFKLIKSING